MKIITDPHSPKGEPLLRPTLRRTFGFMSQESGRELIPGPSQVETGSHLHVHHLSTKLGLVVFLELSKEFCHFTSKLVH